MKKQWTKDRPVEDGVYWVKVGSTGYRDIVRVEGNKVFRFGERNGMISDVRENTQWLGPITPEDFEK